MWNIIVNLYSQILSRDGWSNVDQGRSPGHPIVLYWNLICGLRQGEREITEITVNDYSDVFPLINTDMDIISGN